MFYLKFFDGLKAYYSNLQKAALIHPDPMMRIESKAELAFIRLTLTVLILFTVYFLLGLLFGVFLCLIEGKCL